MTEDFETVFSTKCTEAVLETVEKLQNQRSTELVRMIYQWRLVGDDTVLINQLVMLIMEAFDMPKEVAMVPVIFADHQALIKAMDKRVLIGGEYLYYAPGIKRAEGMAAEAIERNPDKVRCSWCYAEPCICTNQADEMKYDF
jgi:hypothetical protein